MKSLVASTTLLVLVLTGLLIYKRSLAPVQTQEIQESVVVEESIATTTEELATTTATSTEEEN